MKVLICGLPRTGSTVLWSLVNIILNLKYSKHKKDFAWNFKSELPKKNYIIKIHEYLDNHNNKCLIGKNLVKWADVIISTNRNFEDIVRSMIIKKKKKNKNLLKYYDEKKCIEKKYNFNNLNELKLWCSYITKNGYEKWKKYSNYEFVYEKYIKNRKKVISELKEILNCKDIRTEEIILCIDKVKEKQTNNIDHQSKNYNFSLSPEIKEMIKKNFDKYRIKYN